MIKDIIEFFPEKIKNIIIEYINQDINIKKIEEIRFRINQKINIKNGQHKVLLNYIITKEDLNDIFENICEKSIYSYTNQISEGFITIKGGNRVGIVGSCVIDNDKIININDISSLNFRVSKEIKDVSNPILKYVIDIKNNSIFNTLIISVPGCGKTTVLRDLIRKISNRDS